MLKRDNKGVGHNLLLDAEVAEKGKEQARKEGKSFSYWVNQLIRRVCGMEAEAGKGER